MDIMLLGLVIDTKRFAYILQDGEKDVPENLQEALNKVNRLHETLSKEFKIGRTGKEIFDPAPTRVAAHGWGENGTEMLLRHVMVFTENGLKHLDGSITEWYVLK